MKKLIDMHWQFSYFSWLRR